MQSGQVVAGKYRLSRRLGVGGMGEVWAACHIQTERDFAIKIMHKKMASDSEARHRFMREARASARIGHPNIVDVFDVGELDSGDLYLVMELLEGRSLAEALTTDPPIGRLEFLSVVIDVCHALAAAHEAGIVHRDIKPANVFVHQDRHTHAFCGKVLDFGVSKFTQADDSLHTGLNMLLGSPRFMSPEQIRDAGTADGRADIWTIGVILFHGLTGQWPHDGGNSTEALIAIATKPPRSIDEVAPSLHADIRAIVSDCLKPLRQRTMTAVELAQRLEAALMTSCLGEQQTSTTELPPSSDPSEPSAPGSAEPSAPGSSRPGDDGGDEGDGDDPDEQWARPESAPPEIDIELPPADAQDPDTVRDAMQPEPGESDTVPDLPSSEGQQGDGATDVVPPPPVGPPRPGRGGAPPPRRPAGGPTPPLDPPGPVLEGAPTQRWQADDISDLGPTRPWSRAMVNELLATHLWKRQSADQPLAPHPQQALGPTSAPASVPSFGPPPSNPGLPYPSQPDGGAYARAPLPSAGPAWRTRPVLRQWQRSVLAGAAVGALAVILFALLWPASPAADEPAAAGRPDDGGASSDGGPRDAQDDADAQDDS